MPTEANKVDQYQCIDCKEEVFVKQGEQRVHHFCHYKSTNCLMYRYQPTIEGGGETEYHLNAKYKMKSLIETQHEISIRSTCQLCKYTTTAILPKFENMKVVLEHSFIYRDQQVIADLACLFDEQIVFIIEIMYSHATDENKRPSPWFELYSTEVIDTESASKKIQFTCRRRLCDECTILEQQRLKVEREIRQKEYDAYMGECRKKQEQERILKEEEQRILRQQQEQERIRKEEEQRILRQQQEQERIRKEEEQRMLRQQQEQERIRKEEEQRILRQQHQEERARLESIERIRKMKLKQNRIDIERGLKKQSTQPIRKSIWGYK